MPQLECFVLGDLAPDIVPGRPQRAWMEAFPGRHAYRCLPLTMANCTGWEILCPIAFSAEWNGGPHDSDITVTIPGPAPHEAFADFAKSHFSGGVLTFHPGYLFRTPPGWSMWAMGPPNHVKDGIQPLVGLIETDWVPYPFTMNWIFTRPGKVSFAKGEPFCFITLTEDKALEDFEVVQRPLLSETDLGQRFEVWKDMRARFNKRIFDGEPEAMKTAWQRYYFRGQEPGQEPGKAGAKQDDHVNKRRLAAPVHRR
jgi:hypothetical protein